MPNFILLDGEGITWATLWSSFSGVWTSISGFIAANPIFLTIIAVPIVVGIIAVVMKVFR